MKECKIINYYDMNCAREVVGHINSASIGEHPKIEEELNTYLNNGWKVIPVSFGVFYLEREIDE